MSQLIHLKQRIKAIGAIRKIAQTMRLIAMSSHSKLKKQSESMQKFRNAILPILCGLTDARQKELNDHNPAHKTLYIIFSAEKGLCGNFQSTMQHFFEEILTEQNLSNSHVISVGKKTSQYLSLRNITPLYEFDKAMPNNLETIAQD
ncbi:F0F1 ATP synthase subunit gamma, partial [Candidatus Babeliales bacterium]|nr:F0F1 ATP synthase subunit gamma [Candidatus Babeliales bacterium]